MDGEIQRKIPSTLYCQSLLHSFIHQSLTLSLPEQHKGNGEWEWWSAHSSFTLSPCSHSLRQWGLSAGLQLPSGNIHLPQSGVLPRLQWGVWFSISSMGRGGTVCFPSAPPWAAGTSQLWHLKPFPPSFFTDPVSVGWLLTLFFFSSLHSLTAMRHFPFIHCFLKASPAALLELLAVSMGQPWPFLTETSTALPPLLPTPGHQCPIQNLTPPSQKM